ncbi:MAG: hypothetical protein JW990_14830 [Thermoleophilia bacterium]|nr:hypothetical protein [Thermoleophilia bacterium]
MTTSEFERYIVRKPLQSADGSTVKGRQTPMVYLSSRQVPETCAYIELSWIHGMPEPNPYLQQRTLDYDQILLHIGMDYARPQVLGGTVELVLGGQPVVFNTTTAVFIPQGTPYGPLTYKDFAEPHLQMSIVLGSGDPYAGAGWAAAGAAAAAPAQAGGGRVACGGQVEGASPNRPSTVDYESYVVRSPIREAGPDYVEGRQNPTMTYMSGTQVIGVKTYLEIGWIWDAPNRPIPRMRHDNYEEIVCHAGSDPANPEDLGATMRFDVGNELTEYDTTHCVFLPRKLDHGPLIWSEVRRPMIEVAMMLGAGTWADGWEGSFFEE